MEAFFGGNEGRGFFWFHRYDYLADWSPLLFRVYSPWFNTHNHSSRKTILTEQRSSKSYTADFMRVPEENYFILKLNEITHYISVFLLVMHRASGWLRRFMPQHFFVSEQFLFYIFIFFLYCVSLFSVLLLWIDTITKVTFAKENLSLKLCLQF